MQNKGCQTNGKRVDREWSSWILLPVVDESTEWKRMEKREIVLDAAHGGKVGNDSSRTKGMWLKFVKELKTWSAARDHCEDIGGKLFSNVNGTSEQLAFLVDKMQRKYHWLGIYLDNHDNWRDIGEIIKNGRLVWGPRQPNNINNNDIAVCNAPNGILFDLRGSRKQLWFACDLMIWLEIAKDKVIFQDWGNSFFPKHLQNMKLQTWKLLV